MWDICMRNICCPTFRGQQLKTVVHPKESMIVIKHRTTGQRLYAVEEPTLEGADLAGVHLAGADLRGMKLIGADLSAADLTGAILDDADLSFADLSGARLAHASLCRTNLSTTQLPPGYPGGRPAHRRQSLRCGPLWRRSHPCGPHTSDAH